MRQIYPEMDIHYDPSLRILDLHESQTAVWVSGSYQVALKVSHTWHRPRSEVAFIEKVNHMRKRPERCSLITFSLLIT